MCKKIGTTFQIFSTIQVIFGNDTTYSQCQFSNWKIVSLLEMAEKIKTVSFVQSDYKFIMQITLPTTEGQNTVPHENTKGEKCEQ